MDKHTEEGEMRKCPQMFNERVQVKTTVGTEETEENSSWKEKVEEED